MPGTLYIVSTPIGNLEDITQRALRVLREVDLIACEDTRHTRKLLNHFSIDTKTISYHEHNERERAEELCKVLADGKSIALVADAGTPLISDPGFRIVSLAREKGIRVVPIPGATAFVAALAASGLASDQILFAGFLPARANARRAKLEELRANPATLIFYEAPHRIAATLHDAVDVLGDRQAVIARELTKMHEEFVGGHLSELADRFSEHAPRGEMVLIIAGARSDQSRDQEILNPTSGRLAARVRDLENEGVDVRMALKKAARELGLKRDEAYRLWESQKNRRKR
ncbi:MAG TPA: 16S rRNA (cytidine(1402)-2'-O)-methyltransferase [Pyrinomonadaceae bacterium]|nr:16S rRNA (cytidine(1402)-2'-O)-methyltransferase [Pyrinomonadaceae bacterium]